MDEQRDSSQAEDDEPRGRKWLVNGVKLIALVAVPLVIAIAPGPWTTTTPEPGALNEVCIVQDDRITECSGIAISRRTDNAFWMHNDSGSEPMLFLVGFDGKTRATLRLDDAKARDWEDMCSFTLDGRNWLVIADSGDNARQRSSRQRTPCLYVVEEPKPTADAEITSESRAIPFEFEDGPQDCEAMAFDPTSRSILLISKTNDISNCRLYSVPFDPSDEPRVAKMLTVLPAPIVTAMDINGDGSRMVVTTPSLTFVLERRKGQAWGEIAAGDPQSYEVPSLPQIEAACFSADSKKVYVASEGVGQAIWSITTSSSDVAE